MSVVIPVLQLSADPFLSKQRVIFRIKNTDREETAGSQEKSAGLGEWQAFCLPGQADSLGQAIIDF